MSVTLAVFGWWIAAGLRFSGLAALTNSAIAGCAAAGLLAGVMLDIAYLKKARGKRTW